MTTARLSLGELLPGGLMAGTSQRPPSMYWCVGAEGSAVCPGPVMETHNGECRVEQGPLGLACGELRLTKNGYFQPKKIEL